METSRRCFSRRGGDCKGNSPYRTTSLNVSTSSDVLRESPYVVSLRYTFRHTPIPFDIFRYPSISFGTSRYLARPRDAPGTLRNHYGVIFHSFIIPFHSLSFHVILRCSIRFPYLYIRLHLAGDPHPFLFGSPAGMCMY